MGLVQAVLFFKKPLIFSPFSSNQSWCLLGGSAKRQLKNEPHFKEPSSLLGILNRDSLHLDVIGERLSHYENTPMQYTAIFQGCKNVHFQMKSFNIFLIFAQNIDCGYTLEPPQ